MAKHKYEVLYDLKPAADEDTIVGGEGNTITMDEEDARPYVARGVIARPGVLKEARQAEQQVAETEQELAELRAERDAARAEIERLKAQVAQGQQADAKAEAKARGGAKK